MNERLFLVETNPSIYVESVVAIAKACLTSLFATAIKATLDGFPLVFKRR